MEVLCGAQPGLPAAGGAAMLENKELADLVLESLRLMDEGELNPPAASIASPAFQPRAMLALLTYCYAIGVYGSQDVEWMMRQDASLRALCGREIPSWRQLKRFRRQNHAVLQRALEETFRGAWSLSCRARTAGGPARAAGPAEVGNGRPKSATADWIPAEVAARIERAMFIDLMALDD